MKANSTKNQAWRSIAMAAEVAKAAVDTADYVRVESECVESILSAFDSLGLIPPLPEMEYSLKLSIGGKNENGEDKVLLPEQEFLKQKIKAVIVRQPLR